MKTFKKYLWTLLAAAVSVGCTDSPTYLTGQQDDPDNYGVYFPTQKISTTVEVDPADKAEVSFRVRRGKYLDAITVPVEITTSEEGILQIDPIVFAPGEQETEFKVAFPDAVEGVKYTCDIRIKDPKYVSIYGPRATGLSFSVIRAGWKLVTSEDGQYTKGKWRDEIISDAYSLPSKSFNPYPEIEIEIYERKDIPGYYRMKVFGAELLEELAGGAVSFQGRDVTTILDARNPEKVFFPYQSTGLTLVSADGELSFASSVTENFIMEESAGQYGKLENGIITFPAESILFELETESGTFFRGNRNGMLRILLPGVEVPDYTVTLAKREPVDGVVEIPVTFVADAKKMRYAVFEGVFDDGQASLTAQDLDAAKQVEGTFDGTIEKSGTIRVENRKTGKYTLVGCVYDDKDVMREYAFISFGYVAADDEMPVILTFGLEATEEYAGLGITPDNSAKFYAYGEQIESVTYGLFRTDRIRSRTADELLDAGGTKLTAEQLAALNDGHLSLMLKGLVGDTDFTFYLRADNGYVKKIFEGTYRTTGVYNPAMDTFEIEDFLSASEQPTIDYLTSTVWNYYAMNLMLDKEPVREKIGQVTMEMNLKESNDKQTILNIRGLSGIEFDSGGDLFGLYQPTITDPDNKQPGALVVASSDEKTSGTYQGEKVSMGFLSLEKPELIYTGGCMILGAVTEGCLYCVPSPAAKAETGLTFTVLYTASQYNLFSMMMEMLLIDPAKDVGETLSSAALERVAALRRDALKIIESGPRNYVELPAFSGPFTMPEPAMPLSFVFEPMPASAPRAKRAETRTSVVDTVPAVGASDTFRRNETAAVNVKR